IRLSMLETFLIPLLKEQFGEKTSYFNQDLAPAHAAKSTKDWFTKKQLEVLAWPGPTRLTPSNVIANFGAIVKRKIRDRKPTTLDQLKRTSWSKSMPRRLQAVIQAKGAATNY
uniref:Tc1-like transposase DDE domain-containing protein n=1 Tax=Astyanax mexicanus TaxID=7994 RepID=A0A3B1JN07_ASTMX